MVSEIQPRQSNISANKLIRHPERNQTMIGNNLIFISHKSVFLEFAYIQYNQILIPCQAFF